MAFCPDFSDSDDSALSDDCDYHNFKEKVKNINKRRLQLNADTAVDKRQQQLQSLFTALSKGNIKTVIECIDSGISVDVNIQDGWTPLLLAASYGNSELVKELIAKGANVNSERDGCTALMMACNCPETTSPFEKSLEAIKQLIENGADVKAINRKRMTALMYAAYSGNLQAVQYLLPLSNKNAEDNQKWTALFWAVNNNQLDTVKYLLEQGFEYTNSDIRNNTPVDIARNYDFVEITELFPKEEVDTISSVIDSHFLSFDEIFSNLKNHEKPRFFLDVCNILCGVRAESVIKTLSEKNVDLYGFISTSDEKLKELGVHLPYQRNRILGGLYRLHKHPFHPKSLHCVPLQEVYSNTDMAIQLLSTIKQVIAMEASLAYIMKHDTNSPVVKKELPLMLKNIHTIRKKVAKCKVTLKKLKQKTKLLDSQIKPADLITSNSRTHFLPWRKLIFSFSVLSLVLVFKIMK